MKSTMKAFVIQHYGQKKLELMKVPMPAVDDNEVLVEIRAASVNPIDTSTQRGGMKFLLHYDMPLILGSDLAGVVIKVGSSVTNFQIGDEVFGRVNKNKIGTFADYLAVDQSDLALKPINLTFEQSASMPLVSLTAYQILHDMMKIQPHDQVLIQGGSGGLGTVAIQIAKRMGAHVATTTSAKNEGLVKSLGADQIIDYHHENFADSLHDFNFVIDTRGGKTLRDAFKIVRRGGQIVTISGIPNYKFGKTYGLPLWKQMLLSVASFRNTVLAHKTSVKFDFWFMKPSGQQLMVIKQWVEHGSIVPVVDRVYGFGDTQQALDYSNTGHARGKIVISHQI
ncbi:NADP-dependent oxidoreductase [Paucilactobacillus suebicus]|nr:NADP-dependent oxidoreductase [Paucilactobacillus suebicus]